MLEAGKRRAGILTGVGVGVFAAVGLALRLWPFTDQKYGAYGNDEMAYYSAGAALLRGDLPYADYVFVHPPGIAVALAPFAAFGPSGFVSAKVSVALLGTLNIVLVALCAHRWGGRLAAVIAAAVYAVITPSVLASRTLLLEPFLNACVLAAALVLFPRSGELSPRRAAVAGALVAGGCFFKAWGVIYLVAAVVALASRRRPTLGFLAGFGTTGFALSLPFLLTGPGEVVRQVVELQFSRPSVDVPTVDRIVGTFPLTPWLDNMSVGAAIIGAIGVALVVWAVRAQGALGRFWATAFALTAIMFLTSSTFIMQYGDFSGASAAVMLAAASVAIVRWLRRRSDLVAMGYAAVLATVPVALFIDASDLAVFPGISLNDDFRVAAERYIDSDDCFVADSTGFSALAQEPPAYALYGGLLVDDRAAGQDRGGGDSEADLFRNAEAKSLEELQNAVNGCRWVVLQVPVEERVWDDEMRAWFVDAFEVREKGKTGWTLWERA